MALNGLSPRDVEILNHAVSTEDGGAAFQAIGYGSRLAPATAPQTTDVIARRLDSMLNDLPPIHLLKMDIQGDELRVLAAAAGALASRPIRHIVIGTHGREIHDGVAALLTQAGYRIALDDPAPPMQPDGLVVATLADKV
ncbi:MAG: FkbM family methyltransferase [Pseudomonadota bacterium]